MKYIILLLSITLLVLVFQVGKMQHEMDLIVRNLNAQSNAIGDNSDDILLLKAILHEQR